MMKAMVKFMNKIFNFIKFIILKIYGFIDKFIVTPISTLIYKIQIKIGKESKLEKILNRPNVLLYMSLLFAVLLFYVVDVKANVLVSNDAVILTDVPVKVDVLNAYVVEGAPETVDITLIGKKSEIYLARQLGDNYVVLDLNDYKESDAPVRVKLAYNKPINNISYKIDPTYVTVTIKRKVSKQKNITYDLMNFDSLNEKLSVKSVELSRTDAIVRGAEDTIDKIATVKALIDLNNSDFTKAGTYTVDDIKLVAYDSDGVIINNIEINAPNLTANLVLESYSKEVSVKINTNGKLVDGKSISSITINGKSVDEFKVTVYGDESVLEGLDSIPIQPIDIENQGNNGSKISKVTLSKPAGVRHISEPDITVVFNFGEAKQKTITVNGITPKNIPNGLKANLANASDKNIEIQVIGVQSVLDEIDEDNPGISAYVDLTGYKAGTYNDVPVYVQGNDPRLQYTVAKSVSVVVSE